MRAQLKDVKRAVAPSEALSGMAVYADVETVQDAHLGSIEFALEYANQSNHDVELFDPVDYIQYMVLDAVGYPVRTPPFAPRPLIDTGDETEADQGSKFSIVSIKDSTGEKPLPGQLQEQTVTMTPGGKYTITLRIPRIMDEGTPAMPKPIPAGSYKIVIICSLSAPGGPGEENNRSRLLQSEQIPVELS